MTQDGTGEQERWVSDNWVRSMDVHNMEMGTR